MPWWDPEADASVSPDTDSVLIAGQQVARGSLVRLRPGARRSDAQDMFLIGRTAEVQAVLLDVDDQPYLAVSLVDDPDQDLRIAHGRFLYFMPDEVEPCEAGVRNERADTGGRRGQRVPAGRRVRRGGGPGARRPPLQPGVQIRDFGIRGVHLVYELLDGYDLFVLVDAAARGEAPGTVTRTRG